MKIEYKSVEVVGVNEVKDEGNGVITAYVSVTGVEDNVKDVIEPGAYTATLKKRTPKGVWGHQWLTPTSKTLAADELPPGHADLPTELSDGTPWPKEAGALRIKMQFNLGTRRGAEAYSDVKFFDKQQEWSIGYVVPPDGAFKDNNGVRHIKKLDLFEYSPVLFGAMSHARTASVKDAQVGMKLLEGVSALEIKSLEDAAENYRRENGPQMSDTDDDFEGDTDEGTVLDSDDAVLDADDDSEDVDDDDVDAIDPDDFEEADEEKSLIQALSSSMTVKEIRTAYDMLGKVLGVLATHNVDMDHVFDIGVKALIEAKATGYDSVADAVDNIDVALDPSDAKSLRDSARKLDWALKANDQDAAEESATDLMDTLERVMDDTDEDVSLKAVARTIADKAASASKEDNPDDDDDEDYEDTNWEDDDEDDEKKSLSFTAANGIEYKSIRYAGRQFGTIQGGEDLNATERKRAFIGTLPNSALLSLEHVLDGMNGHVAEKQYVDDEIGVRIYSGTMDPEMKLSVPASGGSGQQGRGGGRHRQAVEGRTPGGPKNFGETGWTAKPTGKRLKKVVKGTKKPGRTTKTVNRVTGRGEPLSVLLGEKRDSAMNRETRMALAKRGLAMPDGSFPIETEASLKDAIQAVGRAKDPDAAKAFIRKRAKALGCADQIPDSWKTAVINVTELKSLESFLNDLPSDLS